MSIELLTDIRYAIGQLRPILTNPPLSRATVEDRVRRALDALERVEAELAGQETRELDPAVVQQYAADMAAGKWTGPPEVMEQVAGGEGRTRLGQALSHRMAEDQIQYRPEPSGIGPYCTTKAGESRPCPVHGPGECPKE